MTSSSSSTPGIVITEAEAIEFKKIVKNEFKKDINIGLATMMGSNAIISIELILQNLYKMTDISQENEYEHKSS